MKPTSKEFKQMEYMPVTKTATQKEMLRIFEDKTSNTVNVIVGYFDADGKMLGEDTVQITGANYDLLMQENPEFAPGKPENEYREDDLWYVIDLVKNLAE